MAKGTRTYKSSTSSVFKESVQEAFLKVDKKAIDAGCDLEEHNLTYTLGEVNNEWFIVLLVFKSHLQTPDEFIVRVQND